ncbi:unnamed protein product [Prunus brigantina]
MARLRPLRAASASAARADWHTLPSANPPQKAPSEFLRITQTKISMAMAPVMEIIRRRQGYMLFGDHKALDNCLQYSVQLWY